jgi:hypothetical protein
MSDNIIDEKLLYRMRENLKHYERIPMEHSKDIIRLARLGLWVEKNAGIVGHGLGYLLRRRDLDEDIKAWAKTVIESFPGQKNNAMEKS